MWKPWATRQFRKSIRVGTSPSLPREYLLIIEMAPIWPPTTKGMFMRTPPIQWKNLIPAGTHPRSRAVLIFMRGWRLTVPGIFTWRCRTMGVFMAMVLLCSILLLLAWVVEHLPTLTVSPGVSPLTRMVICLPILLAWKAPLDFLMALLWSSIRMGTTAASQPATFSQPGLLAAPATSGTLRFSPCLFSPCRNREWGRWSARWRRSCIVDGGFELLPIGPGIRVKANLVYSAALIGGCNDAGT